MLLRFAVENFKSFKDKQVFSMIAGKYTKHSNHVLSVNNKRLLKGSFFFGGNASGKSNLLKAVSFSKRIVLDGVRNANLTNMHLWIQTRLSFIKSDSSGYTEYQRILQALPFQCHSAPRGHHYTDAAAHLFHPSLKAL